MLHAGLVLVFIKFGLTVLPFHVFRNWFSRLSSSSKDILLPKHKIDEVVWSVNVMANVLPISLLCLPRALATKYLLRQHPNLVLEIGVEINPRKCFEAHAWVENKGEIIIGNWDSSIAYQRLWSWE